MSTPRQSPQELQRIADATMRRILEYDLTQREKLLAGWLVELTFRAGREEVRIVRQDVLARLTGMHPSAVSLAVKGLQDAGLLRIVGKRRSERWYRILPNGGLLSPDTTADARDVQAALHEIASWNELGPEYELSGQRRLNLPTVADTVDNEIMRASMDLACEITEGRAPPGNGHVHESVTRELSNRQLGDGLWPGLIPRARAPVDSLSDRQIIDSSDSSGSGAGGSGSRKRFRDEERNWILEELTAQDVLGELADERCRRTWVARVRDHPAQIREAIGEVKHQQRTGKVVRSPLGKIFSHARSLCASAGKALRIL